MAEIVTKALEETASFGTKKSALMALGDIGKMICLAPKDALGERVKRHVEGFPGRQYVKGLRMIIESMNEKDVADWIDDQSCKAWVGKIEQLMDLPEAEELFPRLEQVHIALGLTEDDYPYEEEEGDSDDDDW